jgi:hypothetical protein
MTFSAMAEPIAEQPTVGPPPMFKSPVRRPAASTSSI